jgi:hypothetical protein
MTLDEENWKHDRSVSNALLHRGAAPLHGGEARDEEGIMDDIERQIEDERQNRRSRSNRCRAATRKATKLLLEAYPATWFEVASHSIDEAMTYVSVTWSGAPSFTDVEHALALLTADGSVELQLDHEKELTRRRRLALRAAYWMLRDLELADTPQSLGERLAEKLRDFIPSDVARRT